jgi:hypothetical protein
MENLTTVDSQRQVIEAAPCYKDTMDLNNAVDPLEKKYGSDNDSSVAVDPKLGEVEDHDGISPEDLATLRRVSDKVPLRAW